MKTKNNAVLAIYEAGQARSVRSMLAHVLWLLNLVPVVALTAASEPRLLWEIGRADNDNIEFALAPKGYEQWKNDGFFVVGESDARRDWPYVHPGPQDAWAGGREHTYTILFGLQSTPDAGECALQCDLLDTHNRDAPKLRIEVNGRAFEKSLPIGAGDEAVRGQPDKGHEHRFKVSFPSSLLRKGDNEVRLTTLTGSWLLYDWLGLETPAGATLAPVRFRTLLDDVRPVRALQEKDGRMFQPVVATLRHFGEESMATVRVQDGPATSLRVKRDVQTVELSVPAVSVAVSRTVTVEVAGQVVATREITVKPVRKLTVYILPHSHTDIGYTEIQTAIEKKQVNNLIEGMAAARRTAGYPEGARFVWNVEVLWAADLYLRRLDERQRAEFFNAVKNGQVALNGMYLNELTGLCRPEELLRLFRFATRLAEQTGRPIDSAMISDVPGYTWGTVPAMNQAGIRYFSTAPNYFDRIGDILVQWENKPFYWVGPDGKSRVLVWIPFWGYAMSHRYGKMSPQLVDEFSDGLEKRGYPYDIAYVRWSGHGDNAVPDPAICEFVKEWNTNYAWPHFIISGTSEAFHAFEKRHGRELPEVRGDWTPYWEDGAGSSAVETAMNRTSSERLVQAETLFAMLNPFVYPAAEFEDAWRNVLLYSEHTWGADVSVSDPLCQKTREQWDIKQSYARRADQQSRELLEKALGERRAGSNAMPSEVDVFNTVSWTRSELVSLSAELSSAGDRVTDDAGQPVPSQRLNSGELAFLARNVPPFAGRRYTFSAGMPYREGSATADRTVLDNGLLRLRLDEKTGGIIELTARGLDGNFVDTRDGEALNEFLFLPGDNLNAIARNGPVTITTREHGPLVASLLVESEAPGCRRLSREVRLAAGLDYIELLNTVDKKRAAIPAKPGDWQFAQKGGKESVNFAFPFRVPDGEMTLDLPLGWMRPQDEQMPSACKNWFTVGRWADVANGERGITWVTLDAPLVEVGGITANLVGSQNNPKAWRQKVERTQKLYSWAMNNHWGTNYRAYQDGLTVFRFILRPHGKSGPAESSRFATGFSQPLVPARARGSKPSGRPLLRLEPADVLVTALKPSDDGKAWVIRLFGASDKTQSATLRWSERAPKAVFLSDTSEKAGEKAGAAIEVPSRGLVSLRAEWE